MDGSAPTGTKANHDDGHSNMTDGQHADPVTHISTSGADACAEDPVLDQTFTVTTELRPAGPCVVQMSGELDQRAAPALRDALGNVPVEHGVVLDMANLTYCDSSGISILVSACQRAQAAKSWLSLVGLSQQLKHQFRTVGLGEVFAFYSTVDEAARAGRRVSGSW